MASSPSLLVLLFLLFSLSEAREFLVGGKPDSWKIPSSQSDSLNNWAETTRFLVGDSLVWKYDSKIDSVLQVNKRDYVTCNTSSPIEQYEDGNTNVKLDRSGPYYFISGAEGNCEKGQKMIVVVMSARHRRFASISPAPSPAEEFDGPAIAPTSDATSLQATLMMAFGVLIGVVLL